MASISSKERIHALIDGHPFDRTPVTPIFMAWAAHFIGHTYRDYYLNGDNFINFSITPTNITLQQREDILKGELDIYSI